MGGNERGSNKVVCDTSSQFCDQIRGSWCDEEKICPMRQFKVLHVRFALIVPHGESDTGAGDCGKGGWMRQTGRGLGHHDPDFRTPFYQLSNNFYNLVRSDSSRNRHEDPSTGQ
jgi:hypothetical protein